MTDQTLRAAACAAIALIALAACARRDAPTAAARPTSSITGDVDARSRQAVPAQPTPPATRFAQGYEFSRTQPAIPLEPTQPSRPVTPWRVEPATPWQPEPGQTWRIEPGTPWRVVPAKPQLAPMDARPWLLSADPRPAVSDAARPQIALAAPPVKRDLGDGKDTEPLGGQRDSGSTIIITGNR